MTKLQKPSPDVSAEAASGQFALWVAFFEIYNESVFDLLQPPACSKSRKRASLRVCDDGAGNAYVKGALLVCSGGSGRVHWDRGVMRLQI